MTTDVLNCCTLNTKIHIHKNTLFCGKSPAETQVDQTSRLVSCFYLELLLILASAEELGFRTPLTVTTSLLLPVNNNKVMSVYTAELI